MNLQRVWGAESQAENSLTNGPLRVYRNRVTESILQRYTRVKCEECDGILQRVRICSVNQGGTAGGV